MGSNSRVKIETERKVGKKRTSDQLHTAESGEMTLCGSRGLWYVTLCVTLSSETSASDLNIRQDKTLSSH